MNQNVRRTRAALSAGTAAVVAVALLAAPVRAQVPEGSPTDLPVLSRETPRGTGTTAGVPGPSPVAKTIDGDISDWVGQPTRYGGTAVVSGGEFVYQDHLFDAHGPDDGRDASRFEKTDALEEAVPETYRLDALAQADAPGELGIPAPEEYSYNDSYGDAQDHQDSSDLHEVRVAVDDSNVSLLARTTTMNSANDTALLVLADTVAGSPEYEVPFNSGLKTRAGDVALFIADGKVLATDLASGSVTSLAGAAVANPAGWTNAVEAAVPLSAVASGEGAVTLAVASGRPNESGTGFAHLPIEMNDDVPHANVANVAFRFDEPARVWFEKNQALALHDGTMDPFLTSLDLAAMRSGASQQFAPGAGYHDRIFVSPDSTGVPRERGRDGVFQHYGVYVPSDYDGSPVPLQWWLHWRGGNAHTASGVVPKVFKQFGEDRDSIVVSPSGRGTSTWYVGRGHVDVLQVWRDVFETFSIDRERVYVTGHSMGGWGSYLLTLLYPDRFAAAAPVAGPVTQGAWTGADFEGCDEFQFDEYTPCYIGANESRPRDQHTRKLLENARHVPYAILHGTSDELVPYSGVFRQSERLIELGYRHRLYTYPGYEHYTHPVADQWAEAASYLHSFTRPENPARVTYKRSMPFERATEEVQSGGATLNFDFDSAYWISGLEPVDATEGVAFFDGRSLAIDDEAHVAVPDTGAPTAPGQTGPYVISGIQWLDDPTAAWEGSNGFDIALEGTSAVTMDASRMALDTAAPITGAVTTEHALDLGLAGDWARVPEVRVDDQAVDATLVDSTVRFTVPAGTHSIVIVPSDEPQLVRSYVDFNPNSATEGQYGDSVTLYGWLVDEEGDNMQGQTLTFTLGSFTGLAVTDEHGTATIEIPLNDAPGTYTATVRYDGIEGRVQPSAGTVPFTIHREDSALTVDVSGRGSSRTVSATLTDADSGAPISGREVVFSADGQRLGTATTNASGVAKLAVPSGYRGGRYVFTADFAGDTFYLASKASRPS